MMLKPAIDDLQHINDFLKQPTPSAWLTAAAQEIPLLLVDHAHCERKAASTAVYFISKYPEKTDLVAVMSPLAREELLHFEKVMRLLRKRKITFGPLLPSRYAEQLHHATRKKNKLEQLCDQLIVGAIIEARSCERFHAILPFLHDPELEKFYTSLVKAESRHFHDYLRLATLYGQDVEQRLHHLLAVENALICGPDSVLRFHSGVPQSL